MSFSEELKKKIDGEILSRGVNFYGREFINQIKEQMLDFVKLDNKIVILTTARYSSTNSCIAGEKDAIRNYETILKKVINYFNINLSSKERNNITLSTDNFLVVPAFLADNVDIDELTTAHFAEARVILYEIIEHIDPDLVITFGNTPLKTLVKSSGIETKRGREFHIQSETTKKNIPIVPTYNIDYVYMEPQYEKVLVSDIVNSLNKFIFKRNKFDGSGYIECLDLKSALYQIEEASKCEYISIDLETTGLDFLTDKITCIGMSYEDNSAFAIPIHHPASPFTENEIKIIFKAVAELLANEEVKKAFANSKFDLKFFLSENITEFNNIHDIQFMHSLVDENRNHSLHELCKIYFPTELETL